MSQILVVDRRTDRQVLPERLTEVREFLGLTQSQLGDATGLSTAQISRAESGDRRLSAEAGWRVCVALAGRSGARAVEMMRFLDGRRKRLPLAVPPVPSEGLSLGNSAKR